MSRLYMFFLLLLSGAFSVYAADVVVPRKMDMTSWLNSLGLKPEWKEYFKKEDIYTVHDLIQIKSSEIEELAIKNKVNVHETNKLQVALFFVKARVWMKDIFYCGDTLKPRSENWLSISRWDDENNLNKMIESFSHLISSSKIDSKNTLQIWEVFEYYRAKIGVCINNRDSLGAFDIYIKFLIEINNYFPVLHGRGHELSIKWIKLQARSR